MYVCDRNDSLESLYPLLTLGILDSYLLQLIAVRCANTPECSTVFCADILYCLTVLLCHLRI